MSIPATSTFNPNRARIVQLALTNVGAIGPGAVNPTQDAAPLVAHANDILNILVKSMDVDGILQWRSPIRSFTTVAGQAAYVLANDVYDIDPPGRYLVAGQTGACQVTPMAQNEWMMLGDRTLTGTPIQYWLDKEMDAAGLQVNTLNFYVTPANTGDTFEYVAVLKARDQTTDADTLDVTQAWTRCLVYGLTADLAPGYGLDMNRVQYFAKMFEDERQRCLEQDVPHGDVQIAPFGAMSGYSGWQTGGR
jgi:hypothetical protein